MVHREIEQLTPQWFEIKHGKIGGTRASGLYIDSETLTLDILSEVVESFDADSEDDNYTSPAMMYGTDLEPQARYELGKYLGVNFQEAGWIQSDIPLLGISPDGITANDEIQCEIKCPQRKKHVQNCLEPGIHKDYIAQCIHAFTVNSKLKKLYFLSYRRQNDYVPMSVRELTRDSIVDVGLTKKGTVWKDRGKGLKEYVSTEPLLKTVQEWTEYSIVEALKIDKSVKEYLEKFKF
jgi:hypothetical protein